MLTICQLDSSSVTYQVFWSNEDILQSQLQVSIDVGGVQKTYKDTLKDMSFDSMELDAQTLNRLREDLWQKLYENENLTLQLSRLQLLEGLRLIIILYKQLKPDYQNQNYKDKKHLAYRLRNVFVLYNALLDGIDPQGYLQECIKSKNPMKDVQELNLAEELFFSDVSALRSLRQKIDRTGRELSLVVSVHYDYASLLEETESRELQDTLIYEFGYLGLLEAVRAKGVKILNKLTEKQLDEAFNILRKNCLPTVVNRSSVELEAAFRVFTKEIQRNEIFDMSGEFEMVHNSSVLKAINSYLSAEQRSKLCEKLESRWIEIFTQEGDVDGALEAYTKEQRQRIYSHLRCAFPSIDKIKSKEELIDLFKDCNNSITLLCTLANKDATDLRTDYNRTYTARRKQQSFLFLRTNYPKKLRNKTDEQALRQIVLHAIEKPNSRTAQALFEALCPDKTPSVASCTLKTSY